MVVDAGDFFGLYAGPQENLQDEVMAAAWGAAGYDAVAPGENELAADVPDVFALAARHNIPLVTVNVRPPAGAAAPPSYRLVARGGLTVGVVAFLEPGLAPRESRTDVADYKEALAAAVAEVAPRCDVVVCLAHVRDLDAARAFVRSCPDDIDVVVAGHRGAPAAAAENVRGRWLVYTRPWNRYVGVLRLTMERGIITAAENEHVPLTKEMAEDPAAQALVAQYRARLRELVVSAGLFLKPAVEPASGGYFVGSARCASCHDAQAGQWRGTGHARAHDALVAAGRDADPACIRCHVTGYGFKGGFSGAAETPELLGVGCEECHGAGGVHAADPSSKTSPIAEDGCRRCHQPERSPAFDYRGYYDLVKH